MRSLFCNNQHLDQQTIGIQYTLLNYKYKIKEVGFVKVGDVFENNFKTERLNAFSCHMTFFFKGLVNAIPHTWKLLLNNGDYGNHIGRVDKVKDS